MTRPEERERGGEEGKGEREWDRRRREGGEWDWEREKRSMRDKDV